MLLTQYVCYHADWAAGDRTEAVSARSGGLKTWNYDWEFDPNELRDAVERMHGSPAQLVEAVPASESFEGRPAWYGVVCIFDLRGHRSADRCYAWSSRVEGSDQRRFFAMLHTPPIASPADAIRAAVLREPSPDRDGDQISKLTAPHLDKDQRHGG